MVVCRAGNRKQMQRVDAGSATRTTPLPLAALVAVIGSYLVYRDTYHLTATFARSLAPWLARRLPPVR